jgi:hypothetical protein
VTINKLGQGIPDKTIFRYTNADLERLVHEKGAQLEPLLARMEEQRDRFVNETITFAAKWYEDMAKQYVTKKSDVTLNLSREKLVKMKVAVSELLKNADKTVTTALSDSEIWWHLNPRAYESVSQYERVGERFPIVLDTPIRRALGELGVILEHFGYGVVANGSYKGRYMEFWYDYLSGPGSTTSPYFPHMLMWSEEMQNALKRYDELYKQAIVIFNEMKRFQAEKTKRQASELWDSA